MARRVALIGLMLLLAILPAGQLWARQKLYLFNWTQYMNPEVIRAFEKKYDVEVVESHFSSNTELFAKLRSGGDRQYDVIFPSHYYVPRLIATGLIQPLDKKKLPNLANLMARFRHPDYDPQARYSVAYFWGATGVVYNADKLKDPPLTWATLFEPRVNAKYPFAMIKDPQVMMGSACAYLGHGYDCLQPQAWKAAARLLIDNKYRRNFSSFTDGTSVLQQLVRGTVVAGIAYNGDFMALKAEDPEGSKHLRFYIPREGAELWVDTMAIPAHAPHPELAHKFINFVLDARIGAQLANWVAYASPNKAALPYMDDVLRRPPVMPTRQQMQRLRLTPAVEGKKLLLLQQLWTEVQSR